MQARYKVGDIVVIRPDLRNKTYQINNGDGNIGVGDKMFKYTGKPMTIVRSNGRVYHMKEDREEWNWTDEMLQPHFVTEEEAFQALVNNVIDSRTYSTLINEVKGNEHQI